jgi:hypothetical protein
MQILVAVANTPTLLAASRHNTHNNTPIAVVYTIPPDDQQKIPRNMYRLLIEIK